MIVEEDGKWVAALPLIHTKVRYILHAGGLCGGTWTPGGAFLLDAGADADSILDVLVDALKKSNRQLLWFKEVALDAPRWKSFQRAMDRAGIAMDVDAEATGGYLEINRDWDEYYRSLSRDNRKTIERRARRLAEKGDIGFHAHARFDPADVEPLLRKGLAIEDRSWKGESGNSVFQRKEFPFLLNQARKMAEWGYLRLFFLHVGEEPAAFVYGFLAKGVFSGCKIGYDPAYSFGSPGIILYRYILEHLHRSGECRAFDCFGKLTEALSTWRPRSFPLGRIALAPRRLFGRFALYSYRRFFRNDEDDRRADAVGTEGFDRG
ncbi:MAG: GNAT family N-acetyltransferase [Pirellulales bacterium]|nr:GNAT family N-acetyltransferase [Pirellulales bacterium]